MQALLHSGLDVQLRRGGAMFKVDVAGVVLAAYPLWFAKGQADGYEAVAATRDG